MGADHISDLSSFVNHLKIDSLSAPSVFKKENFIKIQSSAKEVWKSFKEIGKDLLKGEFHAKKIQDCGKKLGRLAMRIIPLACVAGVIAFSVATAYIGPASIVGITAFGVLGKVVHDYNEKVDEREFNKDLIQNRIQNFHETAGSIKSEYKKLSSEAKEKNTELTKITSEKEKLQEEIKKNTEDLNYIEINYNKSDEDDVIIKDLQKIVSAAEKKVQEMDDKTAIIHSEIEVLEKEMEKTGLKKPFNIDNKTSRASEFLTIEKKIEELKKNGKKEDLSKTKELIELKYEILKADFIQEYSKKLMHTEYKSLAKTLDYMCEKEVKALTKK